MRKKEYITPPRVMQSVEVLPEGNFMTASLVDGLWEGVLTTPQFVEQNDFSTDDFYFEWE